ncbi:MULTISPECIES: DUF3263 domain-containing protein [unclassified Microbacterium]|uniref:DUF3263 domain-containing protein n=1 Tax=Microbacterium sp. K22 TaxID=2305447 RepID=UPI0014441B35
MTPVDLLAFESCWPRHTPDKVAEIRHRLSISEVRYYQLLDRAAASDEGIRAHPMTARAVRDRAANRAQQRTRRTAA